LKRHVLSACDPLDTQVAFVTFLAQTRHAHAAIGKRNADRDLQEQRRGRSHVRRQIGVALVLRLLAIERPPQRRVWTRQPFRSPCAKLADRPILDRNHFRQACRRRAQRIVPPLHERTQILPFVVGHGRDYALGEVRIGFDVDHVICLSVWR